MSECLFSPASQAFGTILTAFVGSIVNGISSGAHVAFVTGWIAILAWLRIITAAILEFRLTIKTGTDMTDTEAETTYESIPLSNGDATEQKSMPRNWVNLARDRQVTKLGWLGWVWSALYTPISQTIWVAAHFSSPDGGVEIGSPDIDFDITTQPTGFKIARAIAIGVSALGLAYDTRQRYGSVLGHRWGPWAFVAFNIWNATVCLLLGIECAVLLIRGAIDVHAPWFVVVLLCAFSCIWAWASYKILPLADGSGKKSGFLIDTLMGAFSGAFVAAPAIIVWQVAQYNAQTAAMRQQDWGTTSTNSQAGLSLGEYLRCEGVTFAQKFAAIMP